MAFSAEPKGLEEILLHCGTGDLTGSDGFALKGLKLSISLLSKLPRKLQNQKKIHSTQLGFRSRCSSEEPSLLAAPPNQTPLGAGLRPCSQHDALSSQLFLCSNCPSPGLLGCPGSDGGGASVPISKFHLCAAAASPRAGGSALPSFLLPGEVLS